MESLRLSLLKIALTFLSLLVLVKSPVTSALEFSKQRKACGTFHVRRLGDFGHELFFVDGKLVDRYIFCDNLEGDHVKHCFFTRNIGNEYCGLDFAIEKLHSHVGRKFLNTVVREESGGHDNDKTSQLDKDNHTETSLLNPKMLAMAVPVFFVLSCVLLCPCFQARKRATEHTVLSKEPNSIDSSSSLEMNPMFEKFPGSPLRVPPSPLRVPPSPSRFSMSPKLSRLGSVHLNMSQVARLTNNFSISSRIGEGGFGTVYRADLPNGQVVAIKRARKKQAEALQSEFRSEIELLAKIDHRNLVKLLGYVEKGYERLIITEYVPNGTLREHLDGLKGKILDFKQRLEISIDVAHGLTYLHLYSGNNYFYILFVATPLYIFEKIRKRIIWLISVYFNVEKQIIHRDVKSSNILLTESVRAKVADFGFARLGEDSDKSHVSTKVKGTVGYLDPEYMRTNQLTAKSDVYSFGILLLEILTGRRPVDLKRPPEERVMIRWAFKKYNGGKFMDLLDPLMTETVDGEILAKMFGLAMDCAAPTRADRPDMKTVGEQLWGIRMDYLRNERRY